MYITWEEAEQVYRDVMDGAQDIPGGGEAADSEAIAILRDRISSICAREVLKNLISEG